MVMAIKVSQSTIDKIKKMGMTKALAGAKGASPEMKEALTRMYGAKRVSAAGGASTAPKAKSADVARKANMGAGPAKYKSADAARMGTSAQSVSKPKVTTSSNYVAGSRDPRVNAANAREAIAKGSGKKITFGKGGAITNRTGTTIDIRANAARARAEQNKPKTPAQIAAEKAKKVATEKAARQRSANRGYSNR
jgi:hypothetical protein